MTSMVEKVARALYKANGGKDFHSVPPKLYPWAKAAIEAMREPTPEMINCHEEVHWGYSCAMCGGLTEGYQLMLKAALAESKEG